MNKKFTWGIAPPAVDGDDIAPSRLFLPLAEAADSVAAVAKVELIVAAVLGARGRALGAGGRALHVCVCMRTCTQIQSQKEECQRTVEGDAGLLGFFFFFSFFLGFFFFCCEGEEAGGGAGPSSGAGESILRCFSQNSCPFVTASRQPMAICSISGMDSKSA